MAGVGGHDIHAEFARDDAEFRLGTFEFRRRRDEGARIGVACVMQIARRAFLNNAPTVHDEHAIAKARDDREIVRDEDQSHAALGDEIVQDAQHLVLHRHVERGGRFIRDQEIGIGDQHHRDHRALAHAAGKLMRIELKNHFRISDAHRFQHLQRAPFRLASAGPAMQPIGLHDLRADALHGVQRVLRVLHHHGEAPASQRAPFPLAEPSQIAPVESEFARLHYARRGDQAEDRARRRRFARTGLADDAESLPAEREADVAHGAHEAAPAGIADFEPFDLEQRGRAHCDLGSNVSRSPSPRRLNPRLTTKMARPGIVATHH